MTKYFKGILLCVVSLIWGATSNRSFAQTSPEAKADVLTVDPLCEWVVRSGATSSVTEAEQEFCFEGKGESVEILPSLVTSLAIYEAELMKKMGFNPQNPVIEGGDGVYTLMDIDRELYLLLAKSLQDPTSPEVCDFLINISGNLGLVVSEKAMPEQTFRRVINHLVEYFRDVEEAQAYCLLWLSPL